MSNRKFEIVVWGEETIRHGRHLRVEVPDDVTDDEIDSLSSEVLGDVPDGPEWWLEESDGICASMETVDFVGELDSSVSVDARLVRNSNGELELAD